MSEMNMNSIFAAMNARRANAKMNEEVKEQEATVVEETVETPVEEEVEEVEATVVEEEYDEEMDPDIVSAMEEEGIEVTVENYNSVIDELNAIAEEEAAEEAEVAEEAPAGEVEEELTAAQAIMNNYDVDEETANDIVALVEGGGSRRTKAYRQDAMRRERVNRADNWSDTDCGQVYHSNKGYLGKPYSATGVGYEAERLHGVDRHGNITARSKKTHSTRGEEDPWDGHIVNSDKREKSEVSKKLDKKTGRNRRGKYAGIYHYANEEAAAWLEANGYVVDEESIEALLNDWAMEEELTSAQAIMNNYDVDEETANDIVALVEGCGKKKCESVQDDTQANITEKEKKCPQCGKNPCQCKCEEDEAPEADVEEQGGGANLGTAPADNKAERFDGNGEAKEPATSSSKAKDETPESPDVVAKGEKVSTDSKKLKFAEEEESEEAEVTEEFDAAELMCRLEECNGSQYMKDALAEGKYSLVSRYLTLKEA